MTDKKELRKYAKEIKKSLDLKEISKEIQSSVFKLLLIDKPETVMLYMALPDEIETDVLYDSLEKAGVKCCFPVVSGDSIVVKDTSEGFHKGSYGILEPVGNVTDSESIDVCVVPGVMFDTSCHRLGRGGGYYDRFLSKLNCRKIGICADALLADSIPFEKTDVDVDIVVTEKRMVLNGR